MTHEYVGGEIDRNRAQTAKSPIIPTNEIDTEPRSKEANIFSTLADDEAITTFAPAGGLNTLFSATNLANL